MKVILQAIKSLMRKIDNKSYDELKNKPFGSEFVEGVLEYDGDISTVKWTDMNNVLLIKMSDVPLTKGELIGSTIVIKHNVLDLGATGNSVIKFVVTEEHVMEESVDESVYILGVMSEAQMPAILVAHGDMSYVGFPIAEGTYFVQIPEEEIGEGCYFYTHSLSCLNGIKEVITKIDEKYLPEVGLKEDEVKAMIDEAIGEAIGGSY